MKALFYVYVGMHPQRWRRTLPRTHSPTIPYPPLELTNTFTSLTALQPTPLPTWPHRRPTYRAYVPRRFTNFADFLQYVHTQGLYDLRPDLAGAFLDAETEAGMQGMREMLLLCPDRLVRVAMRGFYIHLLCILAEAEGDR